MRTLMRRSSMARLSALPLAFVLNACLYAEKKPQENLLPKDYKFEIIEMVRGSLEDPTNIRDAAISEPVLKPVAGTTRYVICFRYNPRDAHGYLGIKSLAAVYYAGQMTQIINAAPEQCGSVAFQPFLELQKLCRTVNCQG
jgi:hypothetical protein